MSIGSVSTTPPAPIHHPAAPPSAKNAGSDGDGDHGVEPGAGAPQGAQTNPNLGNLVNTAA